MTAHNLRHDVRDSGLPTWGPTASALLLLLSWTGLVVVRSGFAVVEFSRTLPRSSKSRDERSYPIFYCLPDLVSKLVTMELGKHR